MDRVIGMDRVIEKLKSGKSHKIRIGKVVVRYHLSPVQSGLKILRTESGVLTNIISLDKNWEIIKTQDL